MANLSKTYTPGPCCKKLPGGEKYVLKTNDFGFWKPMTLEFPIKSDGGVYTSSDLSWPEASQL